MNYTQCGSALALPYADGIAQTCVTSPPYYGLRDYGTARWEGGDAGCDHLGRQAARTAKGQPGTGVASNTLRDGVGGVDRECAKCGARRIDSQIGLEQTPAAYVAQIVAAMREVWRVLRPDATAWINLGDSYGTGTTAARVQGSRGIGANTQSAQDAVGRVGGMAKQLMGIPWRVAFALQDDGWYLRSDIIWAKPNPMPESVTDRPTKAHEYVFLLSKAPRYFYDAAAIAEPSGGANGSSFTSEYDRETKPGLGMGERKEAATRNARSVWNIATTPYSGAHFATMPPELARRCILAGSRPGDIVLDPFAGSGTTAMVALQNGRRAIGTELNSKYLRLQDDRTQVTIGLGMVTA